MGYDTLACFIACLCFSVAAWLCLAVRAYVRIHLLGGPFLDDILALIGTVIFTPLAALFMINSWHHEDGKSTIEEQMTGVKLGFSMDILYLLGTFVMKLSFARTLSRIVQTRAQSIVLYVTMVVGAVITIAAIIQSFLYCQPLAYFWKQMVESGGSNHCHAYWTRITATLFHAAWVVIADVVLGLLIPSIFLRGCHMNLGTRLSVHALLGLGSIAGIATVIRMPYVAMGIGANMSKDSVAALFWEIAELAINIICTSAATWKPLFYNRGRGESGALEETSRKSPLAGVVGRGWPADSLDRRFSASDPVIP
ncbi:hypothetical protein BJY01DRAFT_209529 [Aspergillus pseudoustus]|uniref:Rhodopsin domain-containing protein n=1 Tax=Aspergillus pseudoustus TaxID=1810923 RepID=A0ABR4KII3_9EURO